MKKYIYILAAVAALASCAKEASINDDLAATNGSDIHELFVSIPDLVDADTKAAISSTDGTFTWTAGDAIAVKTTTGDVYQFTAETGGSQSARFTYTGTMNGTPADVKYPYTADFSDTALPTEIASLTGALGADAIRMSGTISDNAVTLSHQNALLKVTFTNVPTFANKVVFDGDVNDVTVSGISLGSRGTVVAYIPVDASTTTFTVSVQDDNSHYIATKSTTSAKSFTAGTIKNMKPVDVDGHIFVFNDDDKVDEARFFATDGSTINYGTYSYLTLNVLSDGTTKWCILPTSNSWSETGDPVCLQVWKNDAYVSSSECVYLYRDFTFDTSGASLKTNYRVYPKSSTRTSLNMYITKPLSLYIKNTAGWGNVNIYIWGKKNSTTIEPWGDYNTRKGVWLSASGSETVGSESGLARYDLNYELLGSDSASSGLIIGDLSGDNKSGDLHTAFIGDILIDFQVASSSIAGTYFDNRLSEEWPGTAFSGIGSTTNSEKYFEFSSALYGQTVWAVFSDSGANQSTSWSIDVNRDYDYNY